MVDENKDGIISRSEMFQLLTQLVLHNESLKRKIKKKRALMAHYISFTYRLVYTMTKTRRFSVRLTSCINRIKFFSDQIA